MVERPPAPDQAARERIVEDLDSTLFVEAGAGSGKTSSLIDRILALVGSGAAELRHTAAITFTEKAAAELRDRLRRDLEDGAEKADDAAVGARYRLALEQLDAAAVGTLHSFAQRLLTEHPIEAGLPPRLEVQDEVSSGVAFDERWRSFLDELLADASLERTVLLLFACGGRVEALRSVARTFDDNWDVVAERVIDRGHAAPSVHAVAAPVFKKIREICATPCSDPGDLLRLRLDEVHDWIAETEAVVDELELLAALDREGDPRPPTFKVGNAGRPANYDCDVKQLRARLRQAGDELFDGVRARWPSPVSPSSGSASRRSPWTRPGRDERQGPSSFTTCSCSPGSCCATRTTDRRSGPGCTGATAGCCSTSRRTPIRSSSSWPCASPQPIPGPRRRARRLGSISR
jgi:hypothetical protein